MVAVVGVINMAVLLVLSSTSSSCLSLSFAVLSLLLSLIVLPMACVASMMSNPGVQHSRLGMFLSRLLLVPFLWCWVYEDDPICRLRLVTNLESGDFQFRDRPARCTNKTPGVFRTCPLHGGETNLYDRRAITFSFSRRESRVPSTSTPDIYLPNQAVLRSPPTPTNTPLATS